MTDKDSYYCDPGRVPPPPEIEYRKADDAFGGLFFGTSPAADALADSSNLIDQISGDLVDQLCSRIHGLSMELRRMRVRQATMEKFATNVAARQEEYDRALRKGEADGKLIELYGPRSNQLMLTLTKLSPRLRQLLCAWSEKASDKLSFSDWLRSEGKWRQSSRELVNAMGRLATCYIEDVKAEPILEGLNDDDTSQCPQAEDEGRDQVGAVEGAGGSEDGVSDRTGQPTAAGAAGGGDDEHPSRDLRPGQCDDEPTTGGDEAGS